MKVSFLSVDLYVFIIIECVHQNFILPICFFCFDFAVYKKKESKSCSNMHQFCIYAMLTNVNAIWILVKKVVSL
jgi:hypothetical protein